MKKALKCLVNWYAIIVEETADAISTDETTSFSSFLEIIRTSTFGFQLFCCFLVQLESMSAVEKRDSEHAGEEMADVREESSVSFIGTTHLTGVSQVLCRTSLNYITQS